MNHEYNPCRLLPRFGLLVIVVVAGCQSNKTTEPVVTSAKSEPVNLLSNPDFSEGTTGFHSDYTFAINLYPEGTYTVGNNPANYHRSTRHYGDHTTGGGIMLIANGSTDPFKALWSQTIGVKPDTRYIFSGWVASWSSMSRNPAELMFVINGSQAGTTFKVKPMNPGAWSRFSVQWNSGAVNTADIQIIDLVTEALGNDISLDDLSFTEESTSR